MFSTIYLPRVSNKKSLGDKRQSLRLLLLTLILCGYVGCASLEGDPVDSSDSILILPDGKFDTGYYSNLAMELEGDLV